jgi:hypothetical protein
MHDRLSSVFTRRLEDSAMPTPRDDNTTPDRFRVGTRRTAAHQPPGTNLYTRIAGLLRGYRAGRALDVGCGEGALGTAVAGDAWLVGLDGSATMLAAVSPPVIGSETTRKAENLSP